MPSKDKDMMKTVGDWAFILGVLLALVLGVFNLQPASLMLAILAIMGLLVALLNITEKEVAGYLIANIAVLVGANAFSGMLITLATPLNLGSMATILQSIASNLVFFVAPGAVLIALKEIYALAQAN
ncbi:hypothetical protein HZC09_02320 [Candidatus Micrarchaeota archaeon]|nr:hypothetical protein [Candidatus Micrarchaeota archaeon]